MESEVNLACLTLPANLKQNTGLDWLVEPAKSQLVGRSEDYFSFVIDNLDADWLSSKEFGEGNPVK